MPCPNIGPGELILILIIALVVLGPGKLPDVAASLGKSVREFRRAATDVSEAVKLDAAPSTAPAARTTTAPTAPSAASTSTSTGESAAPVAAPTAGMVSSSGATPAADNEPEPARDSTPS